MGHVHYWRLRPPSRDVVVGRCLTCKAHYKRADPILDAGARWNDGVIPASRRYPAFDAPLESDSSSC